MRGPGENDDFIGTGAPTLEGIAKDGEVQRAPGECQKKAQPQHYVKPSRAIGSIYAH